ncbi:hypothetical protein ON010_g12806 [Phytophthora cinnamomi]|nr:hypothetical protein ON010_g12806 [Phytophthora cinnamomi]
MVENTREINGEREHARTSRLSIVFKPTTPVLPFESPSIDLSLPPAKQPPRIHRDRRQTKLTISAIPGTVTLICLTWTIWLILLTLKPNDTVNWVMKTDNFDNGSFWLLVDPPTVMKRLSLCGLLLVVVAYATVLIKMVKRDNRVRRAPHSSRLDSLKADLSRTIIRRASSRQGRPLTMILARAASQFVKDDSLAIKIARVWTKLADLAVETALLYRILEAGSPPALVATFTVIVGLNALSCALLMFLPDGNIGLFEILADTIPGTDGHHLQVSEITADFYGVGLLRSSGSQHGVRLSPLLRSGAHSRPYEAAKSILSKTPLALSDRAGLVRRGLDRVRRRERADVKLGMQATPGVRCQGSSMD